AAVRRETERRCEPPEQRRVPMVIMKNYLALGSGQLLSAHHEALRCCVPWPVSCDGVSETGPSQTSCQSWRTRSPGSRCDTTVEAVSWTDVDALVIGAGVSGLTTAICLAEAGLRVRIWTAEPPLETTSVAAGAMWGPYLVEPVERVRAWSDRTLEVPPSLAPLPETASPPTSP